MLCVLPYSKILFSNSGKANYFKGFFLHQFIEPIVLFISYYEFIKANISFYTYVNCKVNILLNFIFVGLPCPCLDYK